MLIPEIFFAEFLFNSMSTLKGHFALSHREREIRNRRASRWDERKK